jgi:NAD(P)-dependent dehydrogenase (short-subunit alcohol dehydrogenase family)
MMNRFQDKVVIITGATSGIGKTTAIEFGKEGAKVVVAGRRKDEGDAVVAQIVADGAEAIFIKTDVSVDADVRRLVDTTVEKFGRLDCAFNNAGVGGMPTSLTETSEEDWDKVMGINLKGVWLCLKYQILAMLKTGGGNIVNTGSLWSVSANGIGLSPYISSKHGVLGLTRSAALEFANQGIRVNCVCPGWVAVETNAHVLEDPEIKPAIIANIPLGRTGEKKEIAQAVMFMCSDQCEYMTGQHMVIDGGNSIIAG